MRCYFRIQPAGLEVAGHRSESSDGACDGVDVFMSASNVLSPDVQPSVYGDEVLVLSADGHCSNGDVEGVRIDPARAKIVARLSWDSWISLCASLADLPESARWSSGLVWEDEVTVWEVDDSSLDDAVDAYFSK